MSVPVFLKAAPLPWWRVIERLMRLRNRHCDHGGNPLSGEARMHLGGLRCERCLTPCEWDYDRARALIRDEGA